MVDEKMKVNNEAVCEACGRFGAYEFEGSCLCAYCCEERGSCCPEFGGFDLSEENACDASPTPQRIDSSSSSSR